MTVAQILAALQAIIDGAAGEGRELTEEEVNRYTELERELETRRKVEELHTRHAAYMTPAQGLQITSQPKGADTLERAFVHWMRTGQENSDITELRAQEVGVDTAGGYTVPETMRDKIVERMKAYGGVAGIAEQLTTSTGVDLPWPTMDDTGNVGEAVDESTQPAGGADLVFGEATLGAYAYASSGPSGEPLGISWELLQDSAFDIAGKVSDALGVRIARKLSAVFCTGTGTNEPQGLFTRTAYDAMTSNAAGPSYAELLATIHAVDPAYRAEGGCRWVFNDSTLQVIRGLLDQNDRPLLQPADSATLAAGFGETLLGYPITIDQGAPSIGDNTKPIAFGNIREAFVVRTVRDITLVRFNELLARQRQTGFMAWARVDSRRQNDNAYAILAAENTP